MTQVVSLYNVGVLPFECFLIVDSRMPGVHLSDAVLEIPLCVYFFPPYHRLGRQVSLTCLFEVLHRTYLFRVCTHARIYWHV